MCVKKIKILSYKILVSFSCCTYAKSDVLYIIFARRIARSPNSWSQISSRACVYVHLLCICCASDLADISHSTFLRARKRAFRASGGREKPRPFHRAVTDKDGKRRVFENTPAPGHRDPAFPVPVSGCSQSAKSSTTTCRFSLSLLLHAAPSPSLSRTVYLRWQRGHFYPALSLLPLLLHRLPFLVDAPRVFTASPAISPSHHWLLWEGWTHSLRVRSVCRLSGSALPG